MNPAGRPDRARRIPADPVLLRLIFESFQSLNVQMAQEKRAAFDDLRSALGRVRAAGSLESRRPCKTQTDYLTSSDISYRNLT